ncbi:hypothetical protein JOB18_033205 [Solea senegalensis]|uniref:Uncharacterized protein n=1 Tax=Solea senegalensis TaxID=28829 RepID=A0AAV6T8W6_SOLSE|nr:nascent polypeptide-associated complex subunit alpha, muscle-specific form-like [Solea senegalensis]KAG7525881.1 hypothetical protein JOB18_033205 [Solea senegalensis]
MAYCESGGARILLCLGLLVVASSFCRCRVLSRLKSLGKLKEDSALSQGQVEGSGLRSGRLVIGPNSVQDVKRKGTRTTKKRLRFDTDYQADMVWAEARQAQGQGQGEGFSMPKQDNSAVERLLGLEPKVECTGDSMKLKVHDSASTPGSLFYVDRGSQYSPLPLSKLPPSCGYTMTSTRRDFVLVAPYDGCFVSLQEDNYVLPLRWHGLPVRMSCPLMRPSSPSPPMVTCHCEGMVIRTEWILAVDKIKVNLNGNWEPLMDASSKCGFSVVVHPEGVVISVHYAPCLEKKDGMYTLELTGDGQTKISCPVLFETQPKPTGKDPEKQPEMPGKGVHHTIPPRTPCPQSAVPEVPSIPQNPDVPYQKPKWPKETGQSQLPFYPQSPYFFYPYPDTKPLPTAQPSTSPIPKKTDGLQIKQTLPPFIPPQAPNPQSVVPEVPSIPQNPEVPYQKPNWPKETGQSQLPFYPQSPYFFYPYPDTKPLPTAQPSTSPIPKKTDGLQIKQTLPPFIPPQAPNPQSVVPEVPSIPQNPEVPYQKPNWPKETGQSQLPFYPQSPYFFYPYPDTKLLPTAQPSTSPIPKKTDGLQIKQTVPPFNLPVAPQGQVPLPFFPYTWPPQPEKVPEHPAQTPATQPPPVENPFNPYPYYVKPPNPNHFPAQKPELIPVSPPAIQISNGQRPPNHETPPPQGKYVPNPFNPPPEGPPSSGPVPQKPPVSQEPKGQVYQPFNQLPFWPPVWPQGPFQTRMPPIQENQPAQKPMDKPSYPQAPKTPTEKPAPSEQPPHVKPQNGQFYLPNIYYPLQPQLPQPVTPAPSTQPPKQITTAQPKNDDTASQSPQSGYPYMPPMLCPQVCPSGFSNCCPQIAFHQHLHHFVPPGFGNYLTAPPPQEPSEAATTTQSSTSPHPLTKNEKHPYLLPLDGIHAAPGGVPRDTSNTKPIYPYFIPNKHYSYEPQKEMLENSPQTQTADQYNTPDGPGNPVVPYYIQPTGQQMSQLLPVDMNPPSWHDFMSVIAQYQQQHFANEQSEPSAKKLHQSDEGSIEQTRTKVLSVLDRPLVPYSMLQDDQAPTNSSHSYESGSKKPSHKRTIQPKLESQGYILLQRGPPGREPDRLDSDFHHPNLNPPQENLQRPGWLEKMSNPLPVEYRPRPVDESAIDRSHLVPLSSDGSLSAAHFKSEFIKSLKDMWKPTTHNSNQKKPMVQQRHFSDGAQQD